MMLGFRVWDLEFEKFRQWKDIYVNEAGNSFRMDDDIGFDEFNELDRKRYVLMQCTGIKDINGNEIFEGDVLTYKDSDNNLKILLVYDFHHFIRMYHSYVSMMTPWGGNTTQTISDCIINLTMPCEIAGNKFEDPELVERINAGI